MSKEKIVKILMVAEEEDITVTLPTLRRLMRLMKIEENVLDELIDEGKVRFEEIPAIGENEARFGKLPVVRLVGKVNQEISEDERSAIELVLRTKTKDAEKYLGIL